MPPRSAPTATCKLQSSSASAGDAAAKPFTDPLQFEAYNLGHLLTAACIHYRATGKTSLLDVARKAADYFNDLLAQPTPQLARVRHLPLALHGHD